MADAPRGATAPISSAAPAETFTHGNDAAEQAAGWHAASVALATVNIWCLSLQDGCSIDDNSAEHLCMSMSAISDQLDTAVKSVGDGPETMKLMHAKKLADLIGSALWNYLGDEVEKPPSKFDLVLTAGQVVAYLQLAIAGNGNGVAA